MNEKEVDERLAIIRRTLNSTKKLAKERGLKDISMLEDIDFLLELVRILRLKLKMADRRHYVKEMLDKMEELLND